MKLIAFWHQKNKYSIIFINIFGADSRQKINLVSASAGAARQAGDWTSVRKKKNFVNVVASKILLGLTSKRDSKLEVDIKNQKHSITPIPEIARIVIKYFFFHFTFISMFYIFLIRINFIFYVKSKILNSFKPKSAFKKICLRSIFFYMDFHSIKHR